MVRKIVLNVCIHCSANIHYSNYLFVRLGQRDDDIEIKGAYFSNDFDFSFVKRLDYNVCAGLEKSVYSVL